MSQSRASFISKRAITIPAGGRVLPVNIYGRVFACRFAGRDFEMRWNDGEWFDCGQGVYWALKPGDWYERLSFRAALSTNIIFLGGDFDWHENLIAFAEGFEEAGTLIKTHAVTQIAGLGTYDVPGVQPAGSGYGRRKCVILSNKDPSLDLELMGGLAAAPKGVVGTLFSRQCQGYATSDDVHVKNENVTPVNYRVSELYYLE